ncbi:MAG: hypothetical protein ACRC1H_18540, partial [Caldilineaceae bacterium]
MLALAALVAGAILVLVDPEVFRGPGMVGASLAVTCWVFVSPERGRLLAAHRFGAWCLQTCLEGGLRAVVSGLLLVAGVRSEAVWTVALVLPLVGAGVCVLLMRSPWLVPQLLAPVSQRALGWLIAAGLGQQVVLNAGPILVSVGSTALSVAAAGAYLNTLSIARAPQLPIYGVQGAWAPRFAAQLAAYPEKAGRALAGHLKTVGLLLGALSIACLVAGPFLMWLLTGRATISIPLLAVLLAVTAITSISQSLTIAANAMRREFEAARAWLAAAAVMALLGVLAP